MVNDQTKNQFQQQQLDLFKVSTPEQQQQQQQHQNNKSIVNWGKFLLNTLLYPGMQTVVGMNKEL